jgi:hypothetical protein
MIFASRQLPKRLIQGRNAGAPAHWQNALSFLFGHLHSPAPIDADTRIGRDQQRPGASQCRWHKRAAAPERTSGDKTGLAVARTHIGDEPCIGKQKNVVNCDTWGLLRRIIVQTLIVKRAGDR